MDLVLVTPADLRAHWPRISESLAVITAKAPQDWIAEDVYHAIKAGTSACHVGVVDGEYAGVMVTMVTRAQYSGTPSLHVWIVHNAGAPDVMDAALPMLKQMAQRAGAARITFGSPRLGWSKRYPLITATYEMPA